MAGIIVGIEIAIVIAKVGHELGGGIAQMERHGLIAGATHEVECLVDGEIGTVALLARSQINRCLGKRNPALGPPYLVDGIECGIGKQEGIGIGKSDVLGGTNHKATGYELRVLASLNHACKPIEGCIGVAAPDTLDKCRDDVVVHLAILVVGKGILLQAIDHHFVCYNHIPLGRSLNHKFEDVEQLARVAAAIAYHGGGLLEFDMSLTQHHIGVNGTVEQLQEIVLVERLEHI